MLTFFKIDDSISHPALSISKITRDELLAFQMPKQSTLTLRIHGATERDVLAYVTAFETPNGVAQALPRPIGPVVIPRSFVFQIVPEAQDRMAGQDPPTGTGQLSRIGQAYPSAGTSSFASGDGRYSGPLATGDTIRVFFLAASGTRLGSRGLVRGGYNGVSYSCLPNGFNSEGRFTSLNALRAPSLSGAMATIESVDASVVGVSAQGEVLARVIAMTKPNGERCVFSYRPDDYALNLLAPRNDIRYVWRGNQLLTDEAPAPPTIPAPSPAPPLACSELFARWQSAVRMGQNAAVVARLKQLHAACCANMYRRWQEAARMGQNAAVVARLKQLYEQGCRESVSASATPSRG